MILGRTHKPVSELNFGVLLPTHVVFIIAVTTTMQLLSPGTPPVVYLATQPSPPTVNSQQSSPPAPNLLGSPIVLITPPHRAGLIDLPATVDAETRAHEDTGIYEAPDLSLRAYIVPSPASPVLPRPRTQVDLVLPPAVAFSELGTSLCFY